MLDAVGCGAGVSVADGFARSRLFLADFQAHTNQTLPALHVAGYLTGVVVPAFLRWLRVRSAFLPTSSFFTIVSTWLRRPTRDRGGGNARGNRIESLPFL